MNKSNRNKTEIKNVISMIINTSMVGACLIGSLGTLSSTGSGNPAYNFVFGIGLICLGGYFMNQMIRVEQNTELINAIKKR